VLAWAYLKLVSARVGSCFSLVNGHYLG
jgi:hypothetical protein